MSKATEQSIKHRLKGISKALKIPFNPLLETLFLERFLVRIGKSAYADKLIFKGGMCLAQFLNLGRKTKDIDFLLTQIKINLETIKKIMEEICLIDAGDDFIFSNVEVSVLPFEHKKHSSYRVSIQGQLGQIKNKVSIDIGAGDIVDFKLLEVKLMKAKEPLFEKSIRLNSYTPEYIFSEKLEAILQLGEMNSRMKDFYDCYRLIEENIMDKSILKTAIHKTMKNRNTELKAIPKPNEHLIIRWESFLKRNNLSNLKLSAVISKINEMILFKKIN